jgi:hypothetical protein
MRRVRRRWTALVLLAVAAVVAPSMPPASATTAPYRLRFVAAPDGGLHLARWNPCQTITYQVNVARAGKSRLARQRAAADVEQAVALLSHLTGIPFRFSGRTTAVPRSSPGHPWWQQPPAEVVVAWVDQTNPVYRTDLLGRDRSGHWVDGTGGLAYKAWKSRRGWQVAAGRGFVVVNAPATAGLRPGFGAGLTRGELLLHELGHVIGLQHVGATSQTMYPVLLPRARARYHAGDRAGLAALGRSAGCIRVPRDVWPAI